MNILEINLQAKIIADQFIKKFYWYDKKEDWYVVDINFNFKEDYQVVDSHKGETWIKNTKKYTYDLVPLGENTEWLLMVSNMNAFEPHAHYINVECSFEENIILNEMRRL